MKTPVVAILGAGRLAEVLLRLLEAAKTAELRLWTRRDASRADLAARHPAITASGDLGLVVEPAEIVFFTVPVDAIEEVADRFGPYARGDQIVVHAARGVSADFRLPHQLIRARTCLRKIVALGGPLHSRELAIGRALPAAVASRFEEGIAAIRALTAGTPVRVHPSRDVIGVEIAGAISNVSALASGMADALELGETAQGMLLARGLAEAQRLGLALGAEPQTFAGAAGVGDLIPRRVTSTDRHREVGARVARGEDLDAVLAATGGPVEGVVTAKAALPEVARLKLKLPLIEGVARILTGEGDPRATLEALLQLDLDDLVTAARRA